MGPASRARMSPTARARAGPALPARMSPAARPRMSPAARPPTGHTWPAHGSPRKKPRRVQPRIRPSPAATHPPPNAATSLAPLAASSPSATACAARGMGPTALAATRARGWSTITPVRTDAAVMPRRKTSGSSVAHTTEEPPRTSTAIATSSHASPHPGKNERARLHAQQRPQSVETTHHHEHPALVATPLLARRERDALPRQARPASENEPRVAKRAAR